MRPNPEELKEEEMARVELTINDGGIWSMLLNMMFMVYSGFKKMVIVEKVWKIIKRRC